MKTCPLMSILYTIYNAVGCGRPFPPANGTIELYSSTQEGAETQFHCDEGHTPREWKTSQCQENRSWTPDPLLTGTIGTFTPSILSICKITAVNYSPPNITLNGSVTFTTTTYNSSATFMCRSGLVPSDVCTSIGEWEPDPSTLECGDPGIPFDHRIDFFIYLVYVISTADCGIPKPPNNGNFGYSSTIEGSKMKIIPVIKVFLCKLMR